MADSADEQRSRHDDDDNTLESPLRIHAVLRNLQKHRIQLRVVFRGEVDDCISMILRVDPDGTSFLLDEFVPAAGHEMALERRPFSIFARHGGAQVIMRNLVIDAVGEADGTAFYKVITPASMRYIQRRKAFRVQVPQSLQASVQLDNNKRSARIGGMLTDLSGTGCRMLIPHEISPPVAVGERFPRCHLEVPGRESIEVDATARFVAWHKKEEHLEIGVQFNNVEGARERHVWALVNALQRQVRKLEIDQAEG